MEIKYVQIPIETAEDKERREIRERVRLAVAIAQLAVGIAVFILLVAMLAGACLGIGEVSGYPVDEADQFAEVGNTATGLATSGENECDFLKMAPVLRMSAADLYVVEYDNSQFRDEPKMVNPSPLTESEWAVLLEVCDSRSIDPSLALGLIWVESRFQSGVVNKRTVAYGYCQLVPKWHPAGLAPEENIRYGLNLLADLMEKYDSTEAGLCAYHDGHDTGRRGYANEVLAAAEEWSVTG